MSEYKWNGNKPSAYHLAIADNAEYIQPVRSNNFRFLVNATESSPLYDLARAGKNNSDADDNFSKGVASEILDFSVVKFDPPHFSQEPIQVTRGNSTIYFAGKPTFRSGNLVIDDLMTIDGKSVLMGWQALSYNVLDDSIPSSSKYKTNAQIIEYLPDGTKVRSWDLYGCWVEGISEDGYNNESNSKKQVTASIKYDYAVPTFEFNN